MSALATPRAWSVVDQWGRQCSGTKDIPDAYPLYAVCDNCGLRLRCADGSADWVHVHDYSATCSPRCRHCAKPLTRNEQGAWRHVDSHKVTCVDLLNHVRHARPTRQWEADHEGGAP